MGNSQWQKCCGRRHPYAIGRGLQARARSNIVDESFGRPATWEKTSNRASTGAAESHGNGNHCNLRALATCVIFHLLMSSILQMTPLSHQLPLPLILLCTWIVLQSASCVDCKMKLIGTRARRYKIDNKSTQTLHWIASTTWNNGIASDCLSQLP